jgi:molybdopterin converting factor small subunit
VLDFTGGESSFEAKSSPSIRALVDELSGHFGESFSAMLLGGETCFFLVNGKGIMTSGGLETKLRPDDKIDILPLIVAG